LQRYGLNGKPQYWALNHDGGGPADGVVNEAKVTVYAWVSVDVATRLAV
jgi:hypothetical protein